MKQVILAAPGRIEIRDVPLPEPSDGEVLVKINSALTCGTDLKAYVRGHAMITMPGPFGHEYAGTIAKIGKGVAGFTEGDSIMGVHTAPCNACRYCSRGIHHLCETLIERKAYGAFAEYLLIPADVVRQNLFHKPDKLSFHEAALLEPLSCVVHPYSRLITDEIRSALVVGAGPVGLLHLAYLKMLDAAVIVSDFFDNRLEIARQMGADRVTVPEHLPQSLKEATDSMGVDIAIDCTGQLKVWETAVQFVRRGGTVLLFGGCPAGSRVTYDTDRLHYDELRLIGSFHYTPDDVKKAYHILEEGKTDLSMLISGVYPLQDIQKVFSLLEEGKGIKYALKP